MQILTNIQHHNTVCHSANNWLVSKLQNTADDLICWRYYRTTSL